MCGAPKPSVTFGTHVKGNNKIRAVKTKRLDFRIWHCKIQVSPTKPSATQRDLLLSYFAVCGGARPKSKNIRWQPDKITGKRGNLSRSFPTAAAGAVSAGFSALRRRSAEGKGVLFAKFPRPRFDIEVDELDPDKFIVVAAAGADLAALTLRHY